MIYYKSKTGEVFAYETEAERQEWGAPELVQLTEEEIHNHLHAVFAEVGSSLQQVGGSCPNGWIVMQGERPTSEHVAQEDGAWALPEPDYPAIIADRRWQAEVAGITANGMQVDTGRDSQALITGAAVSAMLDPDYNVHWKTAAGFVDLNAEQIIGLASTVRAHVQACFDREAELLAALDAGTFTEAMLEQGWP